MENTVIRLTRFKDTIGKQIIDVRVFKQGKSTYHTLYFDDSFIVFDGMFDDINGETQVRCSWHLDEASVIAKVLEGR